MNKPPKFLNIVLLFCVLAFPFSGCIPATNGQSASQLNGTITISGAFALYPMMQRWSEEFSKTNPNVKFDISAGGAGKGMTDALSGAVEIAMVSREVTKDEVAKGAFVMAVVKDAVIPVVNQKNPVLQDLLAKGVTEAQFEGIYITSKIKTWGQLTGKPEITDEIHVYTRSDAAGAADTWASFLGKKKQENLLGIGVSGDPGLLDAVAKDPLGIGYNNLNYAFEFTSGKPVAGVIPLSIDNNANGQADFEEILETKAKAMEMIANDKYPSPPARVEFLVTKGKPQGLSLAFIHWILTDGQKFVQEGGFIPLTTEMLDASLQKIR